MRVAEYLARWPDLTRRHGRRHRRRDRPAAGRRLGLCRLASPGSRAARSRRRRRSVATASGGSRAGTGRRRRSAGSSASRRSRASGGRSTTTTTARCSGSMQYGPAGFFPRAADLPAGPPSDDAVLVTCAYLTGGGGEWVEKSLFLAAIGEARDQGAKALEAFAYRYPEREPSGGALPRPPHRLSARLPRGLRLRHGSCAGTGRALPARARRDSRRSKRAAAPRCSASSRRRSPPRARRFRPRRGEA